jgi:hypothetical protein
VPELTLPLHIRPLTADDGMDIAMWRYPGPWAVYDSPEAPRPDEGYWAVCDAADRLVGFCCLGDAARPASSGRMPMATSSVPGTAGVPSWAAPRWRTPPR